MGAKKLQGTKSNNKERQETDKKKYDIDCGGYKPAAPKPPIEKKRKK